MHTNLRKLRVYVQNEGCFSYPHFGACVNILEAKNEAKKGHKRAFFLGTP
jgi:hypothetical protein